MVEKINESSAIAGEIMTPYVVMLDFNATFKDIIEKMQKQTFRQFLLRILLNMNII